MPRNLRGGSELLSCKVIEQNYKSAPKNLSTGRILCWSTHLQFRSNGSSRFQTLFLWDALGHFWFTVGAISAMRKQTPTHRAILGHSFLVLSKGIRLCPSVIVTLLCGTEYLHSPCKHKDGAWTPLSWLTSSCALSCSILQLVKNPSPGKTSCLPFLLPGYSVHGSGQELTQWRHPRGHGVEEKGWKSLAQEREKSVVNQSSCGDGNRTSKSWYVQGQKKGRSCLLNF